MAAQKKKQTKAAIGDNKKNKSQSKPNNSQSKPNKSQSKPNKNTSKKKLTAPKDVKNKSSVNKEEQSLDVALPAPVIESDEEEENTKMALPAPILDSDEENELIPPPLSVDNIIKDESIVGDKVPTKKRTLSDNGEDHEDLAQPKVPRKKKKKTANPKNADSSITSKRKQQNINKHKLELPKEHLRRIFEQNKNINDKKFFNNTKKTQLSALKYLPYGILKLIENMPQPWESAKKVKVLYHTSGAITFINEVPKVIPPVYIAQWSSMYDEMRINKRDNFVQRLKFPVFDDDMEIYDYEKDIEGLPIPESISFEIDWLKNKNPLRYSEATVVNDSYRKWELKNDDLLKLFDLSESLRNDIKDANYYNLFNIKIHKNAKALNVSIRDGAKFEPLFGKEDDEDMQDYTEFNSLDRFINRGHDRAEYKLYYPHLYNIRPRKLMVPALSNSINSSISDYRYTDGDFVLGFSDQLNTILDKSEIHDGVKTDFEKQLQENSEVSEFNIEITEFQSTEAKPECSVKEALILLEAPQPFNKKSGKTVRAHDINLLKSWISQHPDNPRYPGKVKKSYQGLLKNKIKTKLRSKKHKKKLHYKLKDSLKTHKKFKKRSPKLLSVLRDTKFFQQTNVDWLEACCR